MSEIVSTIAKLHTLSELVAVTNLSYNYVMSDFQVGKPIPELLALKSPEKIIENIKQGSKNDTRALF